VALSPEVEASVAAGASADALRARSEVVLWSAVERATAMLTEAVTSDTDVSCAVRLTIAVRVALSALSELSTAIRAP
jgi:hypothetical protein